MTLQLRVTFTFKEGKFDPHKFSHLPGIILLQESVPVPIPVPRGGCPRLWEWGRVEVEGDGPWFGLVYLEEFVVSHLKPFDE